MKHLKTITVITTLVAGMGSAYAQNPSNPNDSTWQPQPPHSQTQNANATAPHAQNRTQNPAQNQTQPSRPDFHQGQAQGQRPQAQPNAQANIQPNMQPNMQNQPQLSHAGQPPQAQPNHKAAQPFAVGDTLPKDYRDKSHRVNHKTHNLPAPAKNQAWVQVDGRYLLVNILTNAIVQVLMSS